jgi:hypothetical protein
VSARKIRATYQRLERDSEYRERLLELPRCWSTVLRQSVRDSSGTGLDTLGVELLDCPRKIVEDVAYA